MPTARESFLSLWDRQCRESETSDTNPLVWAVEFAVVTLKGRGPTKIEALRRALTGKGSE